MATSRDARTSLTHPLHIDAVPAGPGRIGMTFCPGKKQPAAATGAWDRDLGIDVEAVRDWGATLVVTALEPHELRALQVPGLGEAIEGAGIEWHLVPIPDAGVPGIEGEARWHLASHRAHGVLDAGGSVVVHCKGGLGRTGMLAARLLVERGADPEEAIRTVRAARPGAIETEEQAEHVRSKAGSGGHDREADDRILGCLLGGAVGDAFGYAVEFDRMPSIRERFGPEGIREPVERDGRLVVSDDTQMTLFTADALLRTAARVDDRGIASLVGVGWRAYRRWLRTMGAVAEIPGEDGWLVGRPELHHRRAPGNTCLGALSRESAPADGIAANDSKGCGTVMRTAPCGLWLDPEEAFSAGRDLSALTHGHPTGYLAGGAMAEIVARLVRGEDPESASRAAIGRLEGIDGGAETVAALKAALDLAASDVEAEEAVRRLGQGWIAEEALAVGLYAAVRGATFRDVFRIAANHDGDSDSTASIAGQIRGAWRGIDDLPIAWARRLDVLDVVLILAHDLGARSGRTIERYPPN